MIDTTNFGQLTRQERIDSLNRALHTQPYFYKMAFPVPQVNDKINEFSQVLGINKDFYLTEIQGNFSQVLNDSGAYFDASFWTGYNESLYRFEAGRNIPTGFLMTEARFNNAGVEKFDDRQFETFPKLIKQNGKIFGQFSDKGLPKSGSIDAITVFKGFAPVDASLNNSEQRDIEASLSQDVRFQYFKITVSDQQNNRGKRSYILENDRFPRLILGFGAINNPTDKAQASNINVNIIDLTKRLQLTDTAIPLEFIAPRLTCVRDTHLYFLPVEYYFMPLSKLQFDIDNIWNANNDPAGAEIVILTRTI